VLFGSLGDDTFHAGSGVDSIAGGWGYNTIYAGAGDDTIEFNRATDTLVSGTGSATAASSLDTSAGSPLLAISYASPVTGTLAAGIQASAQALLKTAGSTSPPHAFMPPAFVAPQNEAASATLTLNGGLANALNGSNFGANGPAALTFAANLAFSGFVSLPASSVPTAPAAFDDAAPDDGATLYAADGFGAYSLDDAPALAKASMDSGEAIRAIPDDEDLVVAAVIDEDDEAPLMWVFDEETGAFTAREVGPIAVLAEDDAPHYDDAFATPQQLAPGAVASDALRRIADGGRVWFDA
jgi:hypothetical protein